MLTPTSLIIGGTGLLGRALVAIGGPATATWHHSPPPLIDGIVWEHLDLRDGAAITRLVESCRPRVVINAAYARGGAHLDLVTGAAPGVVAAAGAAVGAKVVHLSTDVVFAGDRTAAYVESDRPDPVHAYGRAKAAAEQAVTAADPASLVVRTSLLYGATDGVQEQLVRTASREGTAFFVDEVRCPVHVADLAAAIVALAGDQTSGVVHLGGADAVDRLTLARLLASSVGVDPSTLVGAVSDPDLIRPRHVVLVSERDDLGAQAPLPGCRARLH